MTDEYICLVVTKNEQDKSLPNTGYVLLERVTRCRHCAFYEDDGCTLLDFARPNMENNFCSWGVRREP